MPADPGREAFVELLARARAAIFDLAPDEGEGDGAAPYPTAIEALARASAAVADLLGQLEDQDDPLRALLAVDMALAIDVARSEMGRGRGKLAALLVQALSVLGDDLPGDGSAVSLPSRSPLTLANELRALRGAPLLSGNIVFAIALGARTSSANADESASVDPRIASSARRLRSYYQQGLIAWLAGDAHAKAGANRIGEVFARLGALSEGSVQESLWRAAASFAKLLEDPRWRTSTAIKRLLGQLDGQLKGLGDGHTPALVAAPALVQDLLFYLGEGHDVDATIGVFPTRSALLAAFAAPPRAHPDQPAAVLALLNELLSVSGQLMEALAPNETWLAKRNWLTERMLQVADGLGLLGAHRLRHRAVEEITLLHKTAGSGDPPPGGWGQVAERLHALGADLLTAAGMEPAAAVAEDTAGMPSSGHIARRLEADLVHAEGVIQRLEQGATSLPAEPPEPPVALSAGDEAGTAAMLRQRLDELAGTVRSKPDEAIVNEAVAAPPPAPVDHGLLDDIARIAGEIDGARARLEQQVGASRESLQDMSNGLRALREELEGLRIHSETRILSHDPADSVQMPTLGGRAPAAAGMRQRLDSLARQISWLSELRDSIESIASDSRSTLVQQARDNVALAQCLMQTRMRPLDAQLQDLRGEIGERAALAGKQVRLRVDAGGLDIEPEKTAALLAVLRSLIGSFIEGSIDPPRARALAGRPPGCLMEMCFRRRGADLHMVLTVDCNAPEPAAVAEAGAFLRPLSGRLELHAAGKRQTRCDLQMPLAPRVSSVLLVAVGSEILALPLAEVTAVLQLSAEELESGAQTGIEHQEQRWRLGRLGALLALGEESERNPASRRPLVLVASGGARHALMVDAIGERIDLVVRSVVPQLRSVRGLAGAAILGDGQVVLLLDVGQLMESRPEAVANHAETVS